jgi:nucleoside 2-deoxyribosyltransferase
VGLVEKLYPTVDWNPVNMGTEERPNYQITHRFEDIVVHFGPKITERNPYNHLAWDTLRQSWQEFVVDGTALENVMVPAPHRLAYSKIISFITRLAKRDKSIRDLEDFVNLTNHDRFSISGLYDIIRQNGAKDFILESMRSAKIRDDKIVQTTLSNSCLEYFSNLLSQSPHEQIESKLSVTDSEKQLKSLGRKIYIAAPHKNVQLNSAIKREIERLPGWDVTLPYDAVYKELGEPTPDGKSAPKVRDICVGAIRGSQVLIVDLDSYGMDTSWEIGFAEANNIPVIGYNAESQFNYLPRMINRRSYIQNFMHGWNEQHIFDDLDQTFSELKNDSVYVCGSFSNASIHKIKGALSDKVRRLVFPYDFVPHKDGDLPRDYPLHFRVNAIKQMNECDTVLVVLPRYGMDSSWQIGYSTGLGKRIVGVLLEDDCNHGEQKSVWEHWMHGWKEKDMFTGLPKLIAALEGFAKNDII